MNVHTDTGTVWFSLAEVDSITFELGGGVSTPAELRLVSGDLVGWEEDSADGYFAYIPSTLFDIIDGGAVEYNNAGLVEGIRQKLNDGQGGHYTDVFVMDFGDDATATAMFEAKKNSYGNEAALGSYSEATAVYVPVLGGIKAFAHFGKFYIEVGNMGYPDQADARADAVLFLGYYENRI
jgi:hypothetical protein